MFANRRVSQFKLWMIALVVFQLLVLEWFVVLFKVTVRQSVVENFNEPNLEQLELELKLQQELPEIDYSFWLHIAKPQYYAQNRSCAWYPNPLELKYHNIYWQTFINGNVTFHLYAAYLDDRQIGSLNVVRILTTVNQFGQEFPPTYCQLWYANHSVPLVIPVSDYRGIWRREWLSQPDLNYAHLLSCSFSKNEFRLPRTVSLVSHRCQNASNSLRVHYEPKRRTLNTSLSIGVCVKPLDFPYADISSQLIEWIELQKLFGASRIYAYLYSVHPAVQRVLDLYQQSGFLELYPITLPNGMPPMRHYQHLMLRKNLSVKRHNEVISYNDCFYRNMYRHDYLLNVDVDELIMPRGEYQSWQQVLQVMTNQDCVDGYVSLCAFQVIFLSKLTLESRELFFLSHTLRFQNYTNQLRGIKCFHNTRHALTVHNHAEIHSIGGCQRKMLSIHIAHLQHYRQSSDQRYNISNFVEDRSICKYAPMLEEAVKRTQMKLNLG